MLAVKLEDGQQLYKYRDRYYNNASWTSTHRQHFRDTKPRTDNRRRGLGLEICLDYY